MDATVAVQCMFDFKFNTQLKQPMNIISGFVSHRS